MMETSNKIPFYAKTALIFIGIFAFVFTLYLAQNIIIPIVFSILIAILLNPFVNLLIRIHINRVIAISIAVLLGIAVVIGFLYIISRQFNMFSETYPQLKEKINSSSAELVSWISDKFNIREPKIDAWVKETENEAIKNFAFGEKITEAGRIMVNGMLLPVYVFLFLYYKAFLLEFVRRLFPTEHHSTVLEVLTNIKKIVQTYLTGLFFELAIVATLNSVGLLILDIDYAIILGITGAFLNIIPYIGGITATALPMIIAFVTKDSLISPFLVLLLYVTVQLIDNNFIIPKIVASRVKINALVSVIVVLIGGTLWGIPGMFLSIPLTAIIKVIFDNIEPLKPWGYLLGNIVPTVSKLKFVRKTKK